MSVAPTKGVLIYRRVAGGAGVVDDALAAIAADRPKWSETSPPAMQGR